MKKDWIIVIGFAIGLGCSAVGAADDSAKPKVPIVASDFVHVYAPQGDIFPGPDTERLKGGKFYPSWQPNDHCFVQGSDHRWHVFGITHPTTEPGQPMHEGEFMSFHAVSPCDTFEGSFKADSWKDGPKVLPPSERRGECAENHSPTIVKEGDFFKMIYGPIPFRMAVSQDLYRWTPKGPIHLHEKSGRDPGLLVWNNTYYLVYCAGNIVKAATSKNLQDWTEPVEIYKRELPRYQCESPTVVRYDHRFYLFWCLWDMENKDGNGYDERTFVYCSDNPLDFHGKPLLTELKSHAPEVFQTENGDWYISSVQYPARGVNVARLSWQ